jgi:tetratricopeptide (TPR) repeat protein
LLAAAQADYQAAITAQGKALKLHLAYYQAASELGYALRQTGDYRKALGAYNFALQINPDFYPAIEYRGEAYLALGMIDQAKSAYMTLFRNDSGLAGELLTEMEATAAANGPGELADWVAERKTLATLTPHESDPTRQDW